MTETTPKLEYEFKLRRSSASEFEDALAITSEMFGPLVPLGHNARTHIYFDRDNCLAKRGLRLRADLKQGRRGRTFVLKERMGFYGPLRCCVEHVWTASEGNLDLADPLDRRLTVLAPVLAACFGDDEAKDGQALAGLTVHAALRMVRQNFVVRDPQRAVHLFDLVIDDVQCTLFGEELVPLRTATFAELEVELNVETIRAMDAAVCLAQRFERRGYAISDCDKCVPGDSVDCAS